MKDKQEKTETPSGGPKYPGVKPSETNPPPKPQPKPPEKPNSKS